MVTVNEHPEHERNEPFVPVQVQDKAYQEEDREVRGRKRQITFGRETGPCCTANTSVLLSLCFCRDVNHRLQFESLLTVRILDLPVINHGEDFINDALAE